MDNDKPEITAPPGATEAEIIARARAAIRPKMQMRQVINPMNGDSEMIPGDPLAGMNDAALTQLQEVLAKVPQGQQQINTAGAPVLEPVYEQPGKRIKRIIYEDDTVEEIAPPPKDLTKEFGF